MLKAFTVKHFKKMNPLHPTGCVTGLLTVIKAVVVIKIHYLSGGATVNNIPYPVSF
jgi:hypothetical protein